MFLTKPYVSAQEAENRRVRAETLQRDLQEQIRYKAAAKQQEKEKNLAYLKHQQADQAVWEQREQEIKAAKLQRAQQRAAEITQQIEVDTLRRTQEKTARMSAPLPKGKKTPPVEEFLEEPVLSTLGVTIRYVPTGPNTTRRPRH